MTGKERLGRGLGALLGDFAIEDNDRPADQAAATRPPTLPVRTISPNPFQPRREFRPGELDELAASIEACGLLQPILVRQKPGGHTYELVAGERRLRAIKQLGWKEVPASIREVDDDTLLVLALVENLQREELSPLEEAQGYEKLRDAFGFTQEKIAGAVGKNRSTIANMLRLLTLPPSVRRLLEEGSISMGHARAVLAIRDPGRAAEIARQAAAESWSVRETESQVRDAVAPATGRKAGSRVQPTADKPRDPAIGVLEQALAAHLQTRVGIRWSGKGRGAIRIDFHGPRDLERVFAAVTGKDAEEVVG